MVVFAKSYPRDNPETLKAHTEALLRECNNLNALYGVQILELLPQPFRASFGKALELCCKVHDLGKIHTPFQNAIRAALKMELLAVTNGVENIPHNILSPAFLTDLVSEFPKDIQDAIYQAVAFHHSRGEDNISDEGWRGVVAAVEKDLKVNIDRLDEMRPLLDGQLNVKSNYRRRLLRNFNDEYERFYVFLKGLLHRIDHSASAHLVIEMSPLLDSQARVMDYLMSKNVSEADIWQKKLADDNQDKNVILQASTGSGKTEFTLLWLGDQKGFYTLPVRTSVNAMYDRLKKTYKTEDIGLLHSDSYFYAIEEYASAAEIGDQNAEGLRQSVHRMDLAKQLSMPVTVSTADQLFTAAFKYKGYEKIYATLAYSRIIVDEIQSYDPDMVAVILKGLEDITKLGGRFCLVTATLPQFYIDHIRIAIPSVQILPARFGMQKKHFIKTVEASILDHDSIRLIESLYSEHGKALVIVNTVRRAQDLYRTLKDKLPTSLLHAGFIYKDRRKRESEKEEGSIMNFPSGVWITTQLAEVSLDIDFPAMVTELSSIDSQVQRWGRVWRHSSENYPGKEPNVHICLNASGIGSVYDKDLVRLSLNALESRNNTLLSQADEYQLIQDVFADPNFKKTSYFNRFTKSNMLLRDMGFTLETRLEAQKLFRKIASVSFIPHDVYVENQGEIDAALQTLSEHPEKEQRLQALYAVKLYTLSIPTYKTRGINLRQIWKGLDVLSGTVSYNAETGVEVESLGGVIW